MLDARQTNAPLTLSKREIQDRLADAGFLTRHEHASGDPNLAIFSTGKVSLGGRGFDEITGEHRDYIIYIISRNITASTVAALFEGVANVHVSDVHGGPIRPFAA